MPQPPRVASLNLLTPDEGGNESDDGGQDEAAEEARNTSANSRFNRGEAKVTSGAKLTPLIPRIEVNIEPIPAETIAM